MANRNVKWSLQDARAQFSEVVRRSLEIGPQVVMRNGKDAVVVLSVREYSRLTRPQAVKSFAQFLAESPLADVSLEFSRPPDTERSVKL